MMHATKWTLGFAAFAASLFASFTKDFAECVEKENPNWIFSPYSLQTCLSMAALGADGKTKECFSAKPFEIFPIAGVHMANGCWVREEVSLSDTYQAGLKESFGALAKSVPFNPQTVQSINHWVEMQTAGYIADLLPKDALSKDATLCLVSALLVQGVWASPFPEKNTQKALFYKDKASSSSVWMMRQEAAFPYFEDADLQAVALPLRLEKGSLLCVLVLPKGEKEILELPEDLLSSLEQRRVSLSVPKFEVESYLEASGVLRKIGFEEAFSENANFSKIHPYLPFRLDLIFHKVFFSFEEKGLEAAAATAAVMCMTTSLSPEKRIPVSFTANRPFTYFLVDPKCKTPLFAGRLGSPHAI